MKKLIWIVLVSTLLLASCDSGKIANEDSTPSNDIDGKESVSVISDDNELESLPTENSEEVSKSSVIEESVSSIPSEDAHSGENEGGEDWCMVHNMMYHSFSPDLVNYVGQENFENWIRNGDASDTCGVNIVSMVQYFNIPKEYMLNLYDEKAANLTDEYFDNVAVAGITEENYFGTYTLSLEQIDAIYSGDETQIENAFAGDLAVTAENGNLYSLLWLEKHSPEDYLEAGISPESIDALIDEVNTNSDYTKYRTEMQALSEQANQAAVMMESAAE